MYLKYSCQQAFMKRHFQKTFCLEEDVKDLKLQIDWSHDGYNGLVILILERSLSVILIDTL